MPTVGLPELIVIGMMLVLVFGGSRLPQLGESLGRTVRNLRRGFKQDERIEISPNSQADAPPPGDSQRDGDEAPQGGARQDRSGEPEDAEIVDEVRRG